MKINERAALALDFNVRVSDHVQLAHTPLFFEIQTTVAVDEAIDCRFGSYRAVKSAIKFRRIFIVIYAIAVDIRRKIGANFVRGHAPPFVYRLAQKFY